MSSGNSHVGQSALTLEARKHLVLVACTLDRLDLAAKLRRPRLPFGGLAQLTSLPVFEAVAGIAERILPRKLRLLLAVWRTWNRSRSSN